jgi:hypothetical protein
MSNTAPELEMRFRADMGEGLGEMFSLLWGDTLILHRNWHEFVELFGTDQRHFEIMNDAAGDFFRIVQDALLHVILMHICCLSDSSRKAERVSLWRIPDLASTMKEELTPLLEDVKRKTVFARDWRNRLFAHKDLKLALGTSPKPLESASRESIRSAIAAIDRVLQAVEAHYRGSGTSFDLGNVTGGAEDLLEVLTNGLSAAKDLAPGEPI